MVKLRGVCRNSAGGALSARRRLHGSLARTTGVLVPLVYKKERLIPFFFVGGAKGSRIPDLLNAIQTRYQLRYNPVDTFIIQKSIALVNAFDKLFPNFLSIPQKTTRLMQRQAVFRLRSYSLNLYRSAQHVRIGICRFP